MNDLGKIIADKMKAVRQTTGLTQKQFAERIGYGVKTVIAYENGDRVPSVQALQAIIEEFDHSADFLIGTIPGSKEMDERRLELLRNIVMLAQLMSDKDLERTLEHLKIDARKREDCS